MNLILNLFILIPLAGFLISLILPKKERLISGVAAFIVGLHFIGFLIFICFWLREGYPTLNIKDIVLVKTSGYEFYIDFYFDKISAVYLFVGAFLTFLVVTYSGTYLHRESGYKRFFSTILFFYLGYNLVILSGNMETLFIGWEILGVSSFLLIAFYRNRYLPVKNAVKVFSIYRIADVGLILAMWMSHHFWNENITFMKFSNDALVHSYIDSHSLTGVFISLMILMAAAAKSAQLPFSSWLPRAMEGPTPSSAIFYGSLSVHIGVFLLLRMYPFWEHQLSVRILIAVLGLLTSIICTGIARVQSSVKSQIAYSSSAQIGLIFIEVAAGFDNLALIHFAGNAFLRTYQLLLSPSAVTYMIREQFYNFTSRPHTIEDSIPKKISYSLYILSLKEWNLDSFMYQYLWNPLKWGGRKLTFFSVNKVLLFFIPAYIIGFICLFNEELIHPSIYESLPVFFALLGLVMVFKSFTERKLARLSYSLIIMSHFWVALAISFNEHFDYHETLVYLSGIIVSGVVGYICLERLKSLEGNIDLDQFHGHSYKHPILSAVFFLCCLGLSGFPITPTFIGEDLVFSHIQEHQLGLASAISLLFVIDGLSIIRIYARVFLGPHSKSQNEMAYRSS